MFHTARAIDPSVARTMQMERLTSRSLQGGLLLELAVGGDSLLGLVAGGPWNATIKRGETSSRRI